MQLHCQYNCSLRALYVTAWLCVQIDNDEGLKGDVRTTYSGPPNRSTGLSTRVHGLIL